MPKKTNSHVKTAANIKFKQWDELVEENSLDPLELTVGNHEFTVETPTGSTIRELAKVGDDPEAIIEILFGDEDAQIIIEAWDRAPANVMQEWLVQILDYFGLRGPEGNSQPSSRRS